MAKKHNNQIKAGSGFQLSGAYPIDDRTVVEKYEDLKAELVDKNCAYEGMQVYVIADKKTYEYKNKGTTIEPAFEWFTILNGNDLATTNNKGIVQLTISVESDSTTTAATPHSVKTVYDELMEINSIKKLQGATIWNTVGGFESKTKFNVNSISAFIATLLGIQIGNPPQDLRLEFRLPSDITKYIPYISDLTTESRVYADTMIKEDKLVLYWRYDKPITITSHYLCAASYKISDNIKWINDEYPISGFVTADTHDYIDEVYINYAGSYTAAEVTMRIDYPRYTPLAGDSIPAGYLETTLRLPLQRLVYFGPASGTLKTANSSRSAPLTCQNEVDNDYYIIRYPRGWGKLKSIIDIDSTYDLYATAFGTEPRSVDLNGNAYTGKAVTDTDYDAGADTAYYEYKTFKKQTGPMNFTLYWED